MELVNGSGPSGEENCNVDDLLASAQKYMEAGQFVEAKEICHDILKKSPTHSEPYNRLGVIAFHEEQYEIALEFIKTAIQFNDKAPDYHFNLYLCHNKLGDSGGAETALRRTIELEPEHIEANMQLGLLLSSLGLFAIVAPFYEKVLHLQPNNAEAHARLGETYTHLNNIELALTEANTALELDSDNQTALQTIFALMLVQNKPEEALDYGEKLVKLDPQNGEYRKNLDIAYKQIVSAGKH